ncbi:Dam family site-specific DNA-(adenine-N6)-methyltransferase [Atlantibacter hermannii]|uniref:Dam family site-specific DNA-(adenine-N6)-methyltransferase n=1 Tax=Atlantibacter hermannii TaxID=565 RepID=UPI0028A035D4|nr:Dam family site-specific DNA-(adenine-N6)-methyltransferase [Atlantibacter hermannii]
MNTPLSYGSVCSGIEAASIAWESMGLRPAWFAEIEPFPCAVLAHHWPQVTNLGDMTKIAVAIRAGEVEAPDILVGGTPCQAFSIMGMRTGLSDARGQLTLAFVELANAIDDVRKAQGKSPCIIVWENVPGVLSSHDNAFGNFIAGLAGADEAIEPGSRPDAGKNSKFWRWKKTARIHTAKWPHAGGAYGQQRAVAWRLLDAQFFGVAQRRRRCFVIASARNGFDPIKVLTEFESMRRATSPSHKPESNVTRTATSCAHRRGNNPFSGGLTPIAFGGGNTGGAIRVSTTLTTSNQRIDFDTETFITFPYRSDAIPRLKVRRLTPLECERLQGFPDYHTNVLYKGKPATDGPRYKAIGNSMAVPIMRWLMKRITHALRASIMTDTPVPVRPSRKAPATSNKPERNRPFLKWAGGKSSQLDQILPSVGGGKRLIEPFVGAGSIFMNAPGFERYILGDTGADLICLYQTLQQRPGAVIDKARLMFQTQNTNSAFKDIKSHFNSMHYTSVERAAAFLYLNRHAFNGLTRYNKKGEFNTSYGKYKAPYFPEAELVAFSAMAHLCEFACRSFVDTIRLAGKDDVVFCDPPYMSLPETTGFTQYTQEPFTDEHHWQLLNEMVAAHQRGARVVVTNSGHPALIEAYTKAGFNVRDLFARRSMSCKGDKRELALDIIGVLQ